MAPRRPQVALATAMLVASLARVAGAATLTTEPFPGGELSSGTARCAVFNDTAVHQSIDFKLLNGAGGLIDLGKLEVAPGKVAYSAAVDGSQYSPVVCQFVVAKKSDVRASFVWFVTEAAANERVEVIAAR